MSELWLGMKSIRIRTYINVDNGQQLGQPLGPKHTSTLTMINNLGNLYKSQGKLLKAEAMYERAMAGYEKALGSKHTSTLTMVNNLGNLYKSQVSY